jgi:hypothetical protein
MTSRRYGRWSTRRNNGRLSLRRGDTAPPTQRDGSLGHRPLKLTHRFPASSVPVSQGRRVHHQGGARPEPTRPPNWIRSARSVERLPRLISSAVRQSQASSRRPSSVSSTSSCRPATSIRTRVISLPGSTSSILKRRRSRLRWNFPIQTFC